MTSPPRAVALIAAYNEADIVGQVLAHLIREGVQIYFLDDGSTDGTRRIAEELVGRGVMAVEPLREAGSPGEFNWSHILARKQALAQELDADWFIHHDADEFRESPWPGLTLAEGIARVDAAGYNAIDFALFDFWPTTDEPPPGPDIREAFRFFAPPRWFNRAQIKCWKKGPGPLDLIEAGGHDAAFPGRRVYPLRFILRHYPIRGTGHGRRKVFEERLGRFASGERERGWHRQYDEFLDTPSFVRAPSSLRSFEPHSARMEIATEDAHRLDLAREEAATAAGRLAADLRRTAEEIERSARDATQLRAMLARAREELKHVNGIREEVTKDRDRLREAIDAVYASKTWRWSRPIRRLLERRMTARRPPTP
jgi:hypothetical protein